MILNVNAINIRGTARENNEDLVTIGGMVLRDGKFSEEVEFTGTPAFQLLIADGMGGSENGEFPMGCPPTGVVWREDRILLVNEGNGRTYFFRDGIVERLSEDVTELSGRLKEGDILLICSDGLADVVNDDYLEYFLMNSASPAEELAGWAVDNGSADNISVIAARVGGGEFGDSDLLPDDDGRFDAWA